MHLSELLEYVNIVTLGICLCVGYTLKSLFKKIPSRLIPVTMLVLGTAVNVIMFENISAANILSGMISGLVSTGSYKVLKNLSSNKKEKEE